MASINELSQNSNAASDVEVSISGAPVVEERANFAQKAVAWAKKNKKTTAGIVSLLLITAIVAGALAGNSSKSTTQSANALVCVAEEGQFTVSGIPSDALCAVRDDTLEALEVVNGSLIFDETSASVSLDLYASCSNVSGTPIASVICSGDADYEYSA